MTWRSEIWNGPECEFDPVSGEPTPEYEEWKNKLAGEPWIARVLELVEEHGYWTGTAEQLSGELRRKVSNEVAESMDFPDRAYLLGDYMYDARKLFSWFDLDIVDYRDIPAEQLVYYYDTPGWHWDSPILLYREDAVWRDYYLKALHHHDPLPLDLLLVAARERTGSYKRWEGTTSDLISALSWEMCSTVDDLDEYQRVLGPLTQDYRVAFYERMRECEPFLQEIGVHCTGIVRGGQSRTIGNDEQQGISLAPDYWIIEVPRWKHKKNFWD